METFTTIVASEKVGTRNSVILSAVESHMTSPEHIRVLREIMRTLHSQSDPEDLLRSICETLKRFPGADLVAVLRADLSVVAVDPDTSEDRKTVSTTIVREALDKKQALLIRETMKNPKYDKAKSILEQDIRTVICVPISSMPEEGDGDGGPLIGAVYMDRRAGKTHAFNVADLQLMTLVSDQVGYCFGSLEKIGKLERETAILRREIDDRFTLVGKSAAIQRVAKEAEQAAAGNSPVLICGETGVGKEVIARMIHRLSRRSGGAFVPVNCAALAENLVESELFGHVKGAFTGAVADKLGRFELAHGGTLFLDEIGEMKPELQAKLLRVIEDGQVERVGATKARRVDVRIVAATNRGLAKDIETGRFRRDLYYRLNVVEIDIPPLRERPEDVPPLALYNMERMRAEIGSKITGIAEEAMVALGRYSYPGNVRELKNILERCVLFKGWLGSKSDGSSGSGRIELSDLPDYVQATLTQSYTDPGTLEGTEKRRVLEALNQTNWSKTEAAKVLGISRPTLNKKIEDFGLENEATLARGRT